MRKTTVHILSITTSVLLTMAGASLTVISCTKTTAPGTEASPEGAITFSGVDTKAAVEDASEINEFSVWGYYTPVDASSTVFNEVTVTREDSQWKYDGLKFWQSDKQYDFYALYPPVETLKAGAADDITCDASGALSITGFDSTKGHDLMTASCTNMSGNTPQTVNFTFSHELALVSFVGQSEGSNAWIESIELSGVKIKGNYNSSSNPSWSVSDDYTFKRESFDLPSVPTDIFGELIVIPQSLGNDYKLTVQYEYQGVAGTEQIKEIILPDSVTQWEAGKSYRYTFTIVGDYILFSTPEVNAWSEASGGIIIVD